MSSLIKLFLSALIFSNTYGSISDCSSGSSLFQITNLGLSPTNPVVNQPLYMTVQFTNPGPEITDGTVTTSVTYNFIPFSPTVEPLCTNTQCPLLNGFNDRSTNSTWPNSVKGSVVSKIVWTSVDQQVLLCIQINVKSSERNSLRGIPIFLESANTSISDDIYKAFKPKDHYYYKTCPKSSYSFYNISYMCPI
jgi:hypothetical protein